ncbi:MAG: hypothetical protein GY765_43350 [bacterium]|nr:hypothetical protein [bacterium]
MRRGEKEDFNEFETYFLIVLVCVLLPAVLLFFVAMNGYFIAEENCAAPTSIRKGDNPGNITLGKGMAYPLLGKNKPSAEPFSRKGFCPPEAQKTGTQLTIAEDSTILMI